MATLEQIARFIESHGHRAVILDYIDLATGEQYKAVRGTGHARLATGEWVDDHSEAIRTVAQARDWLGY